MPAAAFAGPPAGGGLYGAGHREDARSPGVARPLGGRPAARSFALSDSLRRPTAQSAARRNELVAALARRVLFIHAAPGSKTEAFARKFAASGKPLLTLASPANENLVGMGAEAVGTELRELKGQEWNGPLDAKDTSQCMPSRFTLR